MKHCPNCQTKYADESLMFCLEDGARLISPTNPNMQLPTQVFGEAETVVRQNRETHDWKQSQVTQVAALQPKTKKSNTALIAVLLTVGAGLFFGAITVAFLLLRDNSESDSVSSNLNKPYNSSNSLPIYTGTPPVSNSNGRNLTNEKIPVLNTVKDSTFIGCFKDTSDFDLNGFLEKSSQNTPERCIAACRAKGFKYAGVQYGESCLCGNSYGKYGAADNCDYKCTGDPNRICGGYSANSIYEIGSALRACDYLLSPGIYSKWLQTRGKDGKLGCPIMDEAESATSPQGTTGRYTKFSKGDGGYLILHSSGKFAGTTFDVSGCMNLVYANLGDTKSWLGFPVSDGYPASPGARQDFENGHILWDSKTYECRAYKN